MQVVKGELMAWKELYPITSGKTAVTKEHNPTLFLKTEYIFLKTKKNSNVPRVYLYMVGLGDLRHPAIFHNEYVLLFKN